MSDDDIEWYYCLKHGTAEQGAGCRALDRLGPYPTKAAAEHALETAAEHTREEDAADERWENG
ncbi:hypothetical protein [Yinghuangia soli]|uniref:SPOR domain-containing protein n=1 Tax=Yinghuangia soli TaxID=2908204 RepID=A0AA41Q0F4_9ACTN|nr:hypothetical protein [Yinghuangia soli]MCF2528937.1 hypothetical protein [Yinghuangia soli]